MWHKFNSYKLFAILSQESIYPPWARQYAYASLTVMPRSMLYITQWAMSCHSEAAILASS